jgi:hypothetical protein
MVVVVVVVVVVTYTDVCLVLSPNNNTSRYITSVQRAVSYYRSYQVPFSFVYSLIPSDNCTFYAQGSNSSRFNWDSRFYGVQRSLFRFPAIFISGSQMSRGFLSHTVSKFLIMCTNVSTWPHFGRSILQL